MSIRFENVSKRFGQKEVLRDVSFEVQPGEILFILGRSGMGKSVVLKHMMGLLSPDSGSVWVDRFEVNTLTEEELPQVRQRCGMVFQHPALFDSLTVLDNIAFGLRTPQYQARTQKTLSLEEITEVAKTKLQAVQLEDTLLHRKPPELSYGMQKRVSLARTLAPGPDYLLYDEPTTGLDPISTRAINTLIRDLAKNLQVTSVIVSHDMGCALEIADRILVLDEARILAIGTVPEILQSPIPLIRSFLEEARATQEGRNL